MKLDTTRTSVQLSEVDLVLQNIPLKGIDLLARRGRAGTEVDRGADVTLGVFHSGKASSIWKV